MNIKLTIEYDGTNFFGWQVQRSVKNPGLKINIRTVQQKIEKVLSMILSEEIKLVGASRTDTGVHARGQTANFQTTRKIVPKNLLCSLNKTLPKDIVIKKVEIVNPKFHARYDAKSKVYQYRIMNSRIPTAFDRDRCWHLTQQLDLDKVRNEMQNILDLKDFSKLAVGSNKRDNNRCRIKKFELKKRGPQLVFTIESNRFLYRMIRRIISHLMQIGQGRKNVLPEVAPPQGLCLMKIKY